MKLKDNLTLADYEVAKKYLNKYVLFSVLGGFGLGVMVDRMGRKIKCERKNVSNKYMKNKYSGSELERLVEKMIDRKYEEERFLNDDSIDVKDYLEWCDKYKK